MRTTTLLAILSLTLAAAVLAAGRSTLEEQIEFERETALHEYELNAPEGADVARLRIRARVRGGRLSWELKDPKGHPRISGESRRGRIEGETGDIDDPTPGIWRLELRLEEATGHYEVTWFSK